MILLGVLVFIALLVTIVLPITAAFWLKNNLGTRWSAITYGVMAYFVAQSLMTLLFNGFAIMVENGTLALSEQTYYIIQVVISVVLTAILGVLARWAAMKYLKEKLDNLESAYGIGVGYGGAESIMIMGLPLLFTFISMVANIGGEAAAEAWQMSAFIPVAIIFERITAMVMHLTVSILVLQVFLRKKIIWLVAAVGLEIFVNGIVVGLAESGLDFRWIILVAVILMVGNLYFLYRLNAFDFDIAKAGNLMSESSVTLDKNG